MFDPMSVVGAGAYFAVATWMSANFLGSVARSYGPARVEPWWFSWLQKDTFRFVRFWRIFSLLAIAVLEWVALAEGQGALAANLYAVTVVYWAQVALFLYATFDVARAYR